jgi:hypothetical protein
MTATALTQARDQIRARRTGTARPPWHPPAITDFLPHLRMLAWDASLANVGWVLFQVTSRVEVEAHGTIHPRQSDDGYMGTWQRMKSLQDAIWDHPHLIRWMHDPDILKVVEAPPVGNGHRKESSLIAGGVVWGECDACAVIVPTHVSAVLLGKPKILSAERKPAIKAAVLRFVPEAASRGWDEHQRDGLSVGLTRLSDLREAIR